MSLISYLNRWSTENGVQGCSKCGTADLYFGLASCFDCDAEMPSYSKEKTLLYSVEVFTEFFDKHDDLFPAELKKIPIQFLKGISYGIRTNGSVSDSKIIQLQAMLKKLDSLGSNKLGGAVKISHENPTMQLVPNHNDELGAAKSLSAVLLATNFIFEYKVKNEFVIEPSGTKTASSPQTKGKSGCLTVVIISASLFTLLIEIFS